MAKKQGAGHLAPASKKFSEIDAKLMLFGIEVMTSTHDWFWIKCTGLHPVERWITQNSDTGFDGWPTKEAMLDAVISYYKEHPDG